MQVDVASHGGSRWYFVHHHLADFGGYLIEKQMSNLTSAAMDNDLARPPIIAFGPRQWEGMWTGRQHLLHGLGRRGWPVIYTAGALNPWERGSARWKAAGLFDAFDERDAINVCRPGRLGVRWRRTALLRGAGQWRHARRLVNAARARGGQAPIAFLCHPRFRPYLRHLRPARLVYYVYDAPDPAHGWSDDVFADHAALAAAADLLIVVAEGMTAGLPPAVAEKAQVLPHGVDLSRFVDALDATEPADLAAIPHPRIGYCGRLNYKVDFSIIDAVAERRPAWHWVLTGSVGEGGSGRFKRESALDALWQRCTARANVHYLGEKSRAEVAGYIAHVDVNVMCYRTDEEGWWRAGYPLKLHEYLAVAKPIVSTGLETVVPFADVLALAEGPDDWVQALERAIGGEGVGTPEQRRARAVEGTWDKRVERLEGWLASMPDDRAAPARTA